MPNRLQQPIASRCANDGKILGLEPDQVVVEFMRFITSREQHEIDEFVEPGTTFSQDYRKLLLRIANKDPVAQALFNRFMLWKLTR